MAIAERAPAIGLVAIPRAVLSVAAGVVFSVERAVVGDARVRTARSNAWEAMCADRARNQHRDETRRLVAALVRTASMTSTTAPSTSTAAPSTLTRPTAEPHRLTAQLTVGSSPRSSASQAALVSAAGR
jgi:hypothetical protein